MLMRQYKQASNSSFRISASNNRVTYINNTLHKLGLVSRNYNLARWTISASTTFTSRPYLSLESCFIISAILGSFSVLERSRVVSNENGGTGSFLTIVLA